jgi:hypothetical protein
MTTAPWSPDVDQLLRSSLEHRWRVTITDAAGAVIPLAVTSCTITMDRDWSPFVQGTITAPVPDDQAVLDALDPRTRVRVVVEAGYLLPGYVPDVHPIAVLYLARRSVDRPGDVLTLSVQGEEFIYDQWTALAYSDWQVGGVGPVWDDTTPARDAVTRCLVACGAITGAADPTWDYDNALATVGWADPDPDQWRPGAGDNAIEFARDIASRVNGWFRCDEAGIWRLTARPLLSEIAAHDLKVGANGTVIDSSTELSRDGWANAVFVRYTWEDAAGAAKRAYGSAKITSGPYTPALAGQVTIVIDKGWRGNTTYARYHATNTLRKVYQQGRTINLSAVAAYWLRPLQTVTIQLPVGPQERQQVAAVTYDLAAGAMTISTYLPIEATITGG